MAAPSGPIVRICDRLAGPAGARGALAVERLRREASPRADPDRHASGTPRCDFAKVVELSVDNAPDAVQRYLNRIDETAQFSDSNHSRVPRTVQGIGDCRLGAAGANWIAFLHQLLSARGKRVLIVERQQLRRCDAQRLAAAKAVTFGVYDRLGSGALATRRLHSSSTCAAMSEAAPLASLKSIDVLSS